MFDYLGTKINRMTMIVAASLGCGFAFQGPEVSSTRTNPAVGSFFWNTTAYYDFAASSSVPSRDFSTWTPPQPTGAGVVKAAARWIQNLSGVPECIEVTTLQGYAETQNADTRLWLYDPNKSPTYQSVSDDYNGTRYSRVRFWNDESLLLTVSPYSSAHATIDFSVQIRKLNYANATDCKGTGISFVNTVGQWAYSVQ